MNALAGLMADIYKAATSPKEASSLAQAVDKHLEALPADNRRPGIHVSDLVDPCIRRLAWKISRPDIEDPKPEASAGRFFGQGTITHRWWQNVVYGPMGILLGSWKCRACEYVLAGRVRQPDYKCPKCAKIAWDYAELEVNFFVDDVPVTGNADGILLWEEQEKLLEIKTMRTEQWTQTTVVPAAFVLQGSLYAPALGVHQILVSIIAKDSWATKDFVVPVLPAAHAWAVNTVRTARSVSQTPLKGARACKHGNVVRAKRCGCRKYCFS